jgi:hypothetical protein
MTQENFIESTTIKRERLIELVHKWGDVNAFQSYCESRNMGAVYAMISQGICEVANTWLQIRRGPQIFLSHVNLFKDWQGNDISTLNKWKRSLFY